MGFSKNDQTCIAVLGPQSKPTDGTTPMLCASNIKKAREVLGSRGVNVGEIQQDRQGTHYFEMRDLVGTQLSCQITQTLYALLVAPSNRPTGVFRPGATTGLVNSFTTTFDISFLLRLKYRGLGESVNSVTK